MPDVIARVVHPDELGPGDESVWRALNREPSLGNPFLSWTFVRAVGRAREDARVALFDQGFFPFQLGRDGDGSPIGATICDAQAMIAPPGWAFDARRVVAAAGLCRWSFDHLSVEQAPFAPFHRRRHRSPIVDLRAGHDRFVEEVRAHSKDLLAQVGRRRRKLDREIGPVRFEWQSSRPELDMETLAGWKSGQYSRTGIWDRFAEPWIASTVSSLAQSDDPDCGGVLSALRAGDRLVAAHFGLLGRDRLSWWFPAYDRELGRYSPGLILLLDLIAEAARRGVPAVDLGRGEHDYKLRVTPRFYEVAEGEVVVDG